MLIDLLGMDNYISFNIKLAEILGLHTAIYLSEIMNINEKAVRKSKMDNDFFIIDRNYITKRTTIDRNEQLQIDKDLCDLGILTVKEENNCSIQLNLSVIISLLSGENEAEIKSIKESVKKNKTKKRVTKEQQACDAMKTLIETNNTELYEAYCDWIDAVYAKLHWMSKKAVLFGQKLVDETSNRDLDVALKILELATVNGYKDMTWAVKLYKDNYEPSYRVVNNSTDNYNKMESNIVEVSEEVF